MDEILIIYNDASTVYTLSENCNPHNCHTTWTCPDDKDILWPLNLGYNISIIIAKLLHLEDVYHWVWGSTTMPICSRLQLNQKAYTSIYYVLIIEYYSTTLLYYRDLYTLHLSLYYVLIIEHYFSYVYVCIVMLILLCKYFQQHGELDSEYVHTYL